MLAATAVASPPLALMPFTTSSQAGSLRLETTTLAPCAAICSQIERPMPRLPPVTTATLPVRSNIISWSPRPLALRPLRCASQQCNQLDMRRPQELIDRLQFLQPISGVLQGPRIAGEGRRITRRVDHPRRRRTREFGALGGRPGTGRIEHDGVEPGELGGRERIAEKIAALDGHAAASCTTRGGLNRRNGLRVVFEQHKPGRPTQR